jgi:hypothetical protein
MATKKPAPTKKTAKEKLLEEHTRDLDRRMWNIQDEMIEMGNNIISVWLSDADSQNIFEESVDWILSSEAQKMFESQSGVMAIESVKCAIYQFERHREDNWDEEDNEEETNTSKLYDDVREFFNV